jgi:hypothetical protein
MTQDFRRSHCYDLDQYGLVPGDQASCNETRWANNYVGCGVQWYPPNTNKCLQINPLDLRYRLADLNALIEFQMKDFSQQWNPYEHMDNRIAMSQLQWLDVKNGSGNNRNKDSSFTHFIDKPSDSFFAQQEANGNRVPGFLKF